MILEHSRVAPLMTAEHRSLLQRAREFTRSLARETDLDPRFGFIPRKVWRSLGEQGLLGVSLPASRGGQGLGALGSVCLNVACSEMLDCGLALGLHVQNEVAMHWLLNSRNVALAERWLPLLVSGTVVACTCDTDAAEDAPTLAELDGDHYVLTGTKAFIVNGFHADICMTSCQIGGQRATILVEKDAPGISVERCFDKRGSRLIDSAEIRFSQVRVPTTNVVLPPGVGALIGWNRVISRARYFVVLDACLMLSHALDATLVHGAGRQVQGRRLLEWPVNREAVKKAMQVCAVLEACLADQLPLLDAGCCSPFTVARMKAYGVDRVTECLRSLVDLHGARGYMRDNMALAMYDQVAGLRQSSGSQATMLSIHEAGSRAA